MAAVCLQPRLFTPTPPPKLSPLWSTTPRYSKSTPGASVVSLKCCSVLFIVLFCFYSLLFSSRPIFQWLLIYLVIHTLPSLPLYLWARSISPYLLSIKLILSFLLYKLLHIFTKKKVESKHDLCRSATPKQARLIFLGVRVSSRCPSAQTRLLTALPTSLS